MKNITAYELMLDKDTRHTELKVKESHTYEKDILNNPDDIYMLMKEVFHLEEYADEHVYMLAFNIRMKVIGVFEISHGLGSSSLIDTRGVYIRALQVGASNIVIIHNHPSGLPEPSVMDIGICEKLKSAGELLNIPLADFIIIGDGKFVSFSREGRL